MKVVAKCLHFVMSYMKQNKQSKQTLKSAQYELEIICNHYCNPFQTDTVEVEGSPWCGELTPFSSPGAGNRLLNQENMSNPGGMPGGDSNRWN